MSYILDALKKSDHKRRRQPGGAKIHAAQPRLPRPVQEQSHGRWWLLLVLGLAALTAAGFLVYLRLSLSVPEPQVGAEEVAELSAGGSRPAATPAARASAGPAEPAAEAAPASPPPPTVPELQPAKLKAPPAPAAADSTEIAQPPPLPVAEAAVEESPAAPEVPAVPLLDELDPSLRGTIPEFRLAGHVYSDDPQLRMIIINNRVVRENDVVEKGYVLEEITTDSVILRRGDLRFRLPVD